jgi:uncharacterized spore protein YtfJ
MPNRLTELVAEITDFLKAESNTETVVGKEFTLGEYTCAPVMKLTIGFGYAGKERAAQPESVSSGAGAGLHLEPVGFLVSRGAEISFIPTRNSSGINAAIERIPDLLERFMGGKSASDSTY